MPSASASMQAIPLHHSLSEGQITLGAVRCHADLYCKHEAAHICYGLCLCPPLLQQQR